MFSDAATWVLVCPPFTVAQVVLFDKPHSSCPTHFQFVAVSHRSPGIQPKREDSKQSFVWRWAPPTGARWDKTITINTTRTSGTEDQCRPESLKSHRWAVPTSKRFNNEHCVPSRRIHQSSIEKRPASFFTDRFRPDSSTGCPVYVFRSSVSIQTEIAVSHRMQWAGHSNDHSRHAA